MPQQDLAQRFIDHLAHLGGQEGQKPPDRAAMAALRHSLAFEPGHDPQTFAYVERWVGRDVHADDPRRRALYAVAGLYALHPLSHERALAAAFGELVRRRLAAGREPDAQRPSTERRFLAMLDADADSLMAHLRQAVRLLAAEGLGYDHAALLRDLGELLAEHAWPDRRDRIRRQWAHQFYRALNAEADADADAPSAEAGAGRAASPVPVAVAAQPAAAKPAAD